MITLSSEKDKVLVPLLQREKLAVIDLVNQKVSETDFKFLWQVMVEPYLFKESNLVCIKE